ncbi:hypothetical protein BpHYR1_020138 [Brachionus plicatilis]|uniref:Uncharacterized protein n=1 Tax=Brachionus plicatilis TaxID=10195 RepID=A0A3M7RDN7_BRAPC|nr:hypothetical protein BpHYR1_020138 [Brachionus plicatilis]
MARRSANLVFNGENMSYEEFYNAFGYDAAMYMWNGAVSKVEEHGTMLVSVINLSDEDAQFRQDFEIGEWEEAEILPSTIHDWLDCKTASAVRLAKMRKSVFNPLQQEVRFEQNQASVPDESQQANETMFASPTGTQDLQANKNEVNDFKCSDCELIAKTGWQVTMPQPQQPQSQQPQTQRPQQQQQQPYLEHGQDSDEDSDDAL